MRLGIVCPGNSPHSESWIGEFLEHGHDVIVYAYAPVTQPFSGVTLRHVPPGSPLSRALWLRKAIAVDRLDVVSVHYAGTDAYVLSRLGTPLVVSVWGSDLLLDLEDRPLKRSLVHRAFCRAALVVSPAAHMTTRLRAIGVAEERLVTAQYGIDAARFACSGARSSDVRIISTRAHKPVYRVADLLGAAAIVNPDLVAGCRIAGDGPLRNELESLAGRLTDATTIEFLGVLNQETLIEELCAADIYVSTSESDGASLSLLEAMACGLTPVVSDIPANREWIDDGVDGILYPVGDVQALARAIERAAADPGFRRAAGASVRAKVLARGDRAVNVRRIREAVEAVVAGG